MAELTLDEVKVLRNDLLSKDKQVRKLLRIHDATKDERAKETLLKKAEKWGKKVEIIASKLK